MGRLEVEAEVVEDEVEVAVAVRTLEAWRPREVGGGG